MSHAHLAVPSVVSQQAAADRLSVSVQTITRMIKRGDLAAIRVGRIVRVTVESVEQYLSQKGVTQ